MTQRLASDDVVELAIEALARRGVRQGEVFLREGRIGSVEVKDGEIETVTARAERGVGVRIVDGGRMGFAYTSDLSNASVDECVGAAEAMTRVTEPDPHLAVASETPDESDLTIWQDGADERPLEPRAEVALAVERAARAYDPRITAFRKTSYGDGTATTIVATTAGVRASYRETWFGASTTTVASQDGERQVGAHGEASRTFEGLSAERVGRRAAEIAVRKLGARSFPTQKIPVVLDPWMGLALLGAIAQLFSADNVLKGKSLFTGKVGRPVASAKVTIVDDPRRPGAIRSAPFDGEGVTTTTRSLVSLGTLNGYLHSLKTASKMGTGPTGNARRSSYGGPAQIEPSNLYVAQGEDDPAALVRSLDRALQVTSLLNLHTIDPISGEFSLGTAGDVLERGERAYPVQGITIAGNLTQLLSSIVGVGNDLTFGPSGLGSPTLVISELSVGGTSR